MRLCKSSIVATALLAGTFFSFLWLGRAADRAMDKAGVGDLGSWSAFNDQAAVALCAVALVWFATFCMALSVSRGQERSQLFSVCALALLVAPATWLVAIVA
jgi:hypothetical protein